MTTTGTSGAATYDNTTGVLNIPQYSGGGGGGMAIGGSITSATAGSVLFVGASGVLAQDNTGLFFDVTNDRLGIGSTTLGSNLQVNGNAAIGYSASTAATANGLAVAGRIGVGTTVANTQIHILGSAENTFTDGIKITRNGGVLGNEQALIFNYVGGAAQLIALDTNGGANGQFLWSVSSNGSTTTERMRLAAQTGALIIGATATGSKFQVNGSAAIGYSASTAAPTNGLQVSGDVIFQSKLTINNGIYVGAASSGSGSFPLYFNNTSNAASRSWRMYIDGAVFGDFQLQQSTTQTGSVFANILYFNATGAATFASSITATQLNINGGASTTYGAFNTTTNGFAYLKFDYTGTTYGYIGQNSAFTSGGSTNSFQLVAVNDFRISTGGLANLRLFIDSSGNTTIGSASLGGSKLQVNGNAAIGYSASTAAPTNGLAVAGQSSFGTNTFTTTFNASFGTIAIQSYGVNNGWFGDNVYYDGTNFVRRSTGFAGMFYFQGSEGQFRFGASGAAGGSIGTGVVKLKTNLDGTFAVGNLSTSSGVYTGSTFLVSSTGAGTFNSSVTSTQYRLSALNTAPATSTSTGTLGEIRIDAGAIYVCTATNTWVRALLTTF